MKIALYGATGAVGQRILAEALSRGHEVTAIVRDPSRLNVTDEKLTVKTGDATNTESVAQSVAGHDAVIGSISGRRDGDTSTILKAALTLIETAPKLGGPRILWVGGAGTLEVAPGVRLIDTPEFPAAYLPEAQAGADVLAAFRAAPENVQWTFFSPAAIIFPGSRTGTFRLGGDQFFTDADGNSKISLEDYAVALIDEVENPKHLRQRFSIAY